MSLYLKKDIAHAAFGIWKIQESTEELYAQVRLSAEEEALFACLKTPMRRQHWLSYRLILPHLLPTHQLSSICYDVYGKPYLNNGVRHISVSHSGHFSALIASPDCSVGIDIEAIDPKIHRLSHKFLNQREQEELGPMPATETLYVIWAAKEALYKLHGRRDILFKDHIYIAPFAWQQAGSLEGTIQTAEQQIRIRLSYQKLDDYILAHAVHCPQAKNEIHP